MLLNRYINYGANAAVVDEKEKRNETRQRSIGIDESYFGYE